MTNKSKMPRCSAKSHTSLTRQITKGAFTLAILLGLGRTPQTAAQTAAQARSVECRVENIDYEGWKAQQISNLWLQLNIVPQNGGRLIQVHVNGDDFGF